MSETSQAEVSLLQFFIQCKPALRRMLSGMVDSQDVDDLLQETYIRTSAAAKTKEILNPRAFLFRTAQNLAFNHLATSYMRLTDLEDFSIHEVALPTPDLLSELENQESLMTFFELIVCLPQQCRRAFVLKKVYGLSQREIASCLAISQSTVEKHVAKGTQAFREIMEVSARQAAC